MKRIDSSGCFGFLGIVKATSTPETSSVSSGESIGRANVPISNSGLLSRMPWIAQIPCRYIGTSPAANARLPSS